MAPTGTNSEGTRKGSRRNVRRDVSVQDAPLFCEGWLEKFPLGRSLFSTKGWHRRYFFMTPEGVGYTHKSPRDAEADGGDGKGSKGGVALDDGPTGTAESQRANLRWNLYPYKRALRPASAKCFIPFERRLTGCGDQPNAPRKQVSLTPVYFLENVTAAQHPEAAVTFSNDISYGRAAASGSPSSASPSPVPAGAGGPEEEGAYAYYFGVSFEEKKKRFLLLLRTRNVQTYLKFKFYFRLFTNEASAYSIVPVAHPLEVNKPMPSDLTRKRIDAANKNNNNSADMKKSKTAGEFSPGPAMQLSMLRDPDPCTSDEVAKIKKMVWAWNEDVRRFVSGSSTTFIALRRQLAMPLADCEAEVQATCAEKTEVFTQLNVYDVFNVLGPTIAEEDYERENKELLAKEGTGANLSDVAKSGSGHFTQHASPRPQTGVGSRLNSGVHSPSAAVDSPTFPGGARNAAAAAANGEFFSDISEDDAGGGGWTTTNYGPSQQLVIVAGPREALQATGRSKASPSSGLVQRRPRTADIVVGN